MSATPIGDQIHSPFSSLGIDKRLQAQLRFIREIDLLKTILRKTLLVNGSRVENDAEHSWEMATMAIVLEEYFDEDVDLLTVLKMLLIHDLVEIYAGDSFAYDAVAIASQEERELAAAEVIFGMLPEDLGDSLKSLWLEFEARQSSEAKFARAMDRLQPLLHSYLTRGTTWRENNVDAASVRKIMTVIGDASPLLGRLADALITDAINQGFLSEHAGK